MNRTDRTVARAHRHLAPDETLLASTVGFEHDGRRRQVVLVTNRRVVVAGLRNEAPIELPLVATLATYESAGSRLILDTGGEAALVVRDVEVASARQIVALIQGHRTLPRSATAPRVQHVRIRPVEPDEPSA